LEVYSLANFEKGGDFVLRPESEFVSGKVHPSMKVRRLPLLKSRKRVKIPGKLSKRKDESMESPGNAKGQAPVIEGCGTHS
jgi:hypothetical protein